MERENEYLRSERIGDGERDFPRDPAAVEKEGENRPSWRGFFLAILAAVILSVGATLLLGGSFGFAGRTTASAVCGPGQVCCPPAETASGGR